MMRRMLAGHGRDPPYYVPMQRALELLPDDQLRVLAHVVRDVPRLSYQWILAATEWEQRRRHNDSPGHFPSHRLTTEELWGAISNLWDVAARIRANSDVGGLARIAAVLDAAIEALTMEMERTGERLQ